MRVYPDPAETEYVPVDLKTTIPISMSFALLVLIDTVGFWTPVLSLWTAGSPELESNGDPVFAPAMPKTTNSVLSDPLNDTVMVSLDNVPVAIA
jgi:hypothetical protein